MNTELLIWKQEYSVGLSTVDMQHKRFLNIINEFGVCIADKSINEKGKQLFFSLLHFTEEFIHKEKMLANSIDHVDYSYFREKHSKFLAKLKSFKDEYIKTATEQNFIDLYQYLRSLYPDFISYYTPSLLKILRNKGIE